MRGPRLAGWHAALLWSFAALMGGVARVAMVAGLRTWTTDGRLAVSPWTYATINTAQIAVTGAVFFLALYHSEDRA